MALSFGSGAYFIKFAQLLAQILFGKQFNPAQGFGAEVARKAGAEIWAYYLMPNHAHIIIVPTDEDGLRRTFADAHRRYTGYTPMRLTGHLWQGCIGSVVMDEKHLMHAVRDVSLNPVRAKLVERAEEWP